MSTPKLSPLYRTDDAAGVPAEVKQYLDKTYFADLPHKTTANPKVLVVFSGGNAMGKSTLSKVIGERLGALVLENDDIKERLVAYNPELSRDELNTLTWQYSMDLYARLGALTPNGLVVRDGVIDWYFDRILPVFERQGYKLFIIGFDVSRALREELIRKRGDKPTITVDRLLSLMPEQDIHIARFRRQHTPDIILNDETLFDAERVVRAIREVIETQKQT